jgi:hypothetical protein
MKENPFSQAFKPLRDEIAKQKDERRKQKETSSASCSMGTWLATMIKRLFYVAFLLGLSYLLFSSCLLFIQLALGFIIGIFNFTMDETTELVVFGMTALFIVAWVFTASFYGLRLIVRWFVTRMRKTRFDVAE